MTSKLKIIGYDPADPEGDRSAKVEVKTDKDGKKTYHRIVKLKDQEHA